MKISKRTARLVREAAVLGFVNGVWSAKGTAPRSTDIPPDSAVVAEVIRAARSFADLYPLLAHAEFPEDDPAIAWLEAEDAERLAALRALIDGRSTP